MNKKLNKIKSRENKNKRKRNILRNNVSSKNRIKMEKAFFPSLLDKYLRIIN